MSLFRRGNQPLVFVIFRVDATTYAQLREIIIANGGAVTTYFKNLPIKFTQIDKYSHNIYPEAKIYDIQFIYRCVELSKIVDPEPYRLSRKLMFDDCLMSHFLFGACNCSSTKMRPVDGDSGDTAAENETSRSAVPDPEMLQQGASSITSDEYLTPASTLPGMSASGSPVACNLEYLTVPAIVPSPGNHEITSPSSLSSSIDRQVSELSLSSPEERLRRSTRIASQCIDTSDGRNNSTTIDESQPVIRGPYNTRRRMQLSSGGDDKTADVDEVDEKRPCSLEYRTEVEPKLRMLDQLRKKQQRTPTTLGMACNTSVVVSPDVSSSDRDNVARSLRSNEDTNIEIDHYLTDCTVHLGKHTRSENDVPVTHPESNGIAAKDNLNVDCPIIKYMKCEDGERRLLTKSLHSSPPSPNKSKQSKSSPTKKSSNEPESDEDFGESQYPNPVRTVVQRRMSEESNDQVLIMRIPCDNEQNEDAASNEVENADDRENLHMIASENGERRLLTESLHSSPPSPNKSKQSKSSPTKKSSNEVRSNSSHVLNPLHKNHEHTLNIFVNQQPESVEDFGESQYPNPVRTVVQKWMSEESNDQVLIMRIPCDNEQNEDAASNEVENADDRENLHMIASENGERRLLTKSLHSSPPSPNKSKQSKSSPTKKSSNEVRSDSSYVLNPLHKNHEHTLNIFVKQQPESVEDFGESQYPNPVKTVVQKRMLEESNDQLLIMRIPCDNEQNEDAASNEVENADDRQNLRMIASENGERRLLTKSLHSSPPSSNKSKQSKSSSTKKSSNELRPNASHVRNPLYKNHEHTANIFVRQQPESVEDFGESQYPNPVRTVVQKRMSEESNDQVLIMRIPCDNEQNEDAASNEVENADDRENLRMTVISTSGKKDTISTVANKRTNTANLPEVKRPQIARTDSYSELSDETDSILTAHRRKRKYAKMKEQRAKKERCKVRGTLPELNWIAVKENLDDDGPSTKYIKCDDGERRLLRKNRNSSPSPLNKSKHSKSSSTKKSSNEVRPNASHVRNPLYKNHEHTANIFVRQQPESVEDFGESQHPNPVRTVVQKRMSESSDEKVLITRIQCDNKQNEDSASSVIDKRAVNANSTTLAEDADWNKPGPSHATQRLRIITADDLFSDDFSDSEDYQRNIILNMPNESNTPDSVNGVREKRPTTERTAMKMEETVTSISNEHDRRDEIHANVDRVSGFVEGDPDTVHKKTNGRETSIGSAKKSRDVVSSNVKTGREIDENSDPLEGTDGNRSIVIVENTVKRKKVATIVISSSDEENTIPAAANERRNKANVPKNKRSQNSRTARHSELSGKTDSTLAAHSRNRKSVRKAKSNSTECLASECATDLARLQSFDPLAGRGKMPHNRLPYTDSERKRIIKFLVRTDSISKAKGQKIFEDMSCYEPKLRHRSPSSLYNEFIKMLPNIERHAASLRLKAAIIAEFKELSCNKKRR